MLKLRHFLIRKLQKTEFGLHYKSADKNQHNLPIIIDLKDNDEKKITTYIGEHCDQYFQGTRPNIGWENTLWQSL